MGRGQGGMWKMEACRMNATQREKTKDAEGDPTSRKVHGESEWERGGSLIRVLTFHMFQKEKDKVLIAHFVEK